MAEKVDPTTMPGLPSGAPAKYPWQTWMDGDWWLLKKGEDYEVETRSFRATVQQYARRRGHVATTRLVEGGLLVQFLPVESKSE